MQFHLLELGSCFATPVVRSYGGYDGETCQTYNYSVDHCCKWMQHYFFILGLTPLPNNGNLAYSLDSDSAGIIITCWLVLCLCSWLLRLLILIILLQYWNDSCCNCSGACWCIYDGHHVSNYHHPLNTEGIGVKWDINFDHPVFYIIRTWFNKGESYTITTWKHATLTIATLHLPTLYIRVTLYCTFHNHRWSRPASL